MSFDWKSLVSTIAPVLGTALGGPFGGMATKAIAGALLGDDVADTVPQSDLAGKISEALQHDSEALVKLKAADQAFDTRMKELDIDILAIDAKDRDSARAMAQNTGLKPQIILASVYVVAFGGVLFAVFSGAVNLEGPQLNMANILIGILSAGLVQIMNFFFGSSAGSKAKTDAMVAPK